MKEEISKIVIIIFLVMLIPVLLYFSLQAFYVHPIIMTLGFCISTVEYKYGKSPTDPRPFAISLYFIVLTICCLF